MYTGRRPAQDHEDVYGQAAGAGHHGDDEHGDQAALVVLYGACGHDGGYVAAEAHDHGDERLAVQAYLVHELVHDEGGAGHVSGVLQQ